MDRRVKERLIGASILVALVVLVVPELLSGPKPVAQPATTLPAAAPEPTRNVTVDLTTSKPPANSEPEPAESSPEPAASSVASARPRARSGYERPAAVLSASAALAVRLAAKRGATRLRDTPGAG